MNHSMKKFSVVAVSLLALSGCARNISPNTYKASHVGEASFTYQGVVASARQVVVENSEELEQNSTGILGGGLAGGLAGNQFGGGSGNVAATVGGAVLGGIAGAFAEKALKSQDAMEYVVRLNNGSMMTVVQGMDLQLAMGQRVLVMVSHDGRSRVVPDQTGINDVQPMVSAPAQKVNINLHR